MITKQAFDKLSAMGIDLYQLKELPVQESYLPIDADGTEKDPFFNNVLKAINLAKAEVSITDSAIDLGSLLWCFANEEQIKMENSKLVTPPLKTIKASSQLKKQLWSTLSSQLL